MSSYLASAHVHFDTPHVLVGGSSPAGPRAGSRFPGTGRPGAAAMTAGSFCSPPAREEGERGREGTENDLQFLTHASSPKPSQIHSTNDECDLSEQVTGALFTFFVKLSSRI